MLKIISKYLVEFEDRNRQKMTVISKFAEF